MNKTNYTAQKVISSLVILTGVILLTFMIVVEDEPGAIPLFVIMAGIAWFFTIRKKVEAKNTW